MYCGARDRRRTSAAAASPRSRRSPASTSSRGARAIGRCVARAAFLIAPSQWAARHARALLSRHVASTCRTARQVSGTPHGRPRVAAAGPRASRSCCPTTTCPRSRCWARSARTRARVGSSGMVELVARARRRLRFVLIGYLDRQHAPVAERRRACSRCTAATTRAICPTCSRTIACGWSRIRRRGRRRSASRCPRPGPPGARCWCRRSARSPSACGGTGAGWVMTDDEWRDETRDARAHRRARRAGARGGARGAAARAAAMPQATLAAMAAATLDVYVRDDRGVALTRRRSRSRPRACATRSATAPWRPPVPQPVAAPVPEPLRVDRVARAAMRLRRTALGTLALPAARRHRCSTRSRPGFGSPQCRRPIPDWLARGRAHQREGRAVDAMLCYRRAARAAPKAADPRYHLGEVLWQLGRAAEARAAWRETTALSPRHVAARQALAEASLSDRRPAHGPGRRREALQRGRPTSGRRRSIAAGARSSAAPKADARDRAASDARVAGAARRRGRSTCPSSRCARPTRCRRRPRRRDVRRSSRRWCRSPTGSAGAARADRRESPRVAIERASARERALRPDEHDAIAPARARGAAGRGRRCAAPRRAAARYSATVRRGLCAAVVRCRGRGARPAPRLRVAIASVAARVVRGSRRCGDR